MSDPRRHHPAKEAEDVFEHLMETRPKPSAEVAAALADLRAAQDGVARSLDDMTGAAQSALDIPAKIRRNPVKTAALVGGTGFLVLGGPRRAVRFVARRVLPQPRPDPYAGLLPPEIEKVLKDSSVASDPDVRRALNKDFAEYLRKKGKLTREPHAAASFWRTFDRLAGPLGTAGARVMVQRLMEAEQDRADHRAVAHERATRRSGARKA